MPMLRMTIKYVNSPLEGKSRGTIKDADGNKMLVMPHNLRLFEPGKTYDIAYTETGGWKTAQSATAVEASPPGATSTTAPSASNGRPADLPGGEFNRQTSPVDAKRMCVCAWLTAAIHAGKVELDPRSLADATSLLMRLYDWAFEGNQGTFTSGAARVARG